MTASYWQVGRRIVEHEHGGAKRWAYGKELIQRLPRDLTAKFGRGFGVDNLELFHAFYVAYPPAQIRQTVPGKSESSIRKSEPSLSVGKKSDSLVRKSSLQDPTNAKSWESITMTGSISPLGDRSSMSYKLIESWAR